MEHDEGQFQGAGGYSSITNDGDQKRDLRERSLSCCMVTLLTAGGI